MLWTCYGEYILNNLQKYLKYKTKAIQCVDCGEWIEVNIKDNKACRCDECQKEYRKQWDRERKRKNSTQQN